MKSEEYYKELDKLLSKFNNGKERYKTSPLFHRTIDLLVRGADVYEVIDDLIIICDKTQNVFEDYVKKHI